MGTPLSISFYFRCLIFFFCFTHSTLYAPSQVGDFGVFFLLKVNLFLIFFASFVFFFPVACADFFFWFRSTLFLWFIRCWGTPVLPPTTTSPALCLSFQILAKVTYIRSWSQVQHRTTVQWSNVSILFFFSRSLKLLFLKEGVQILMFPHRVTSLFLLCSLEAGDSNEEPCSNGPAPSLTLTCSGTASLPLA